MKVKEMNVESRPREKLIEFGSRNLSNCELLAIIIGTGTREMSVIELANFILSEYTIADLSQLNFEKLSKIKGIKKSKACNILACFELAKRSISYEYKSEQFLFAEDVYMYMNPILANKKNEYLYVLYVDAKSKLQSLYLVSEGEITSVNISIRKIISKALDLSAYGIIMVHNHPSGDITPSKNDIRSTEIIINACEIMEIEFIDHIIIGKNNYYSFYENNTFKKINDIEFE